MSIWRKIRDSKIAEGYSEEAAYKFATEEMKRRRSLFDPYSIVGLDETTAKEQLEENGYKMRVTKRDVGECDIFYLDWQENRCNVSIQAGLVTEISSIG